MSSRGPQIILALSPDPFDSLPAGLRATADDEGDEDDGAFSDEDAYEEYEELVCPVRMRYTETDRSNLRLCAA